MKFLSAGREAVERKTASGNCGSMISRDLSLVTRSACDRRKLTASVVCLMDALVMVVMI